MKNLRQEHVVKKIEKYIDEDTFMMTYGDGVADINIEKLVKFHKVTWKDRNNDRSPSTISFRRIYMNRNHVLNYNEKPQTKEGLINGGFFVFNKEFFDYLSYDDDCILERKPLEKLAENGELMLYNNEKFWQCVDTYRELEVMNSLWKKEMHPGKFGNNSLGRTYYCLKNFGTKKTFLSRDVLDYSVHGLQKALVEKGANVTGLIRDLVPKSNLNWSGFNEKINIVRGDINDYFLLERVLNEYEIDTVFHLAAQTIVTIANRNPLSTFESNIKGTWNLLEACRRNQYR